MAKFEQAARYDGRCCKRLLMRLSVSGVAILGGAVGAGADGLTFVWSGAGNGTSFANSNNWVPVDDGNGNLTLGPPNGFDFMIVASGTPTISSTTRRVLTLDLSGGLFTIRNSTVGGPSTFFVDDTMTLRDSGALNIGADSRGPSVLTINNLVMTGGMIDGFGGTAGRLVITSSMMQSGGDVSSVVISAPSYALSGGNLAATVNFSTQFELSGSGTIGSTALLTGGPGATLVQSGGVMSGTATGLAIYTQSGGGFSGTVTTGIYALTNAASTSTGGSINASDFFLLGLPDGVAVVGATLSGTGQLVKSGDAIVLLTGNNNFTGATTVNGGSLIVNGSIASSSLTTVNSGATLGGNGTVGNTTINGGALAPGNSIGLLTVQGNLVFTAASSYMVEISPSNADRTNATGSATLGNATVNANFAAGTYVAKQYTILNAAGGVNGTFSGPANTNLPGGFKSSLSYDASNAFLNLALDFTTTPTPNFGGGLSGNQQAVGNALINFFNTTGGIPLVFGSLTPTGLTQISGETATGSQQTTFNAMNQFLGVMTDPFIAGRGDPISAGGNPNAYADEGALAYAAKRRPGDALAAIYAKAPPIAPVFEQRWSIWAAGYGGSQRTDGNTFVGSKDTRSSIYGTAVGADYRISPNTLAGFALAGGGTNFSVDGFGSGRSDLFQAGAFIRHNVGAAYLSGALAYGWQDVTTDRTVTVAGVDRLRAQFNANTWSGRIEGGYRIVSQGFGWTPYAAGQFTTFELPAYAERAIVGSNVFALGYNSESVANTRSELGFRTDKSFAVQDGVITLRGRVAWAHDYDPDRSIGVTFQALPGASFVVNGARQAADALLVTGSAEMKWINGWSVATVFDGELSDVTRSYAGRGMLRYSW
jgi:autotransporter-associated beta strand protein